MRTFCFIMGIAVLLLFPSFMYSIIVLDEDGEIVTTDDIDEWDDFFSNWDQPAPESREPVQEQIIIDIEIEYSDTYIPFDDEVKIIIKTRSPFLTNCFFHIRPPDSQGYDVLSVNENRSLREEETQGRRRIHEQSFEVIIPRFYIGKDIHFYIRAINLIGREAFAGSPQAPYVIRAVRKDPAVSMGTQIFIFILVLMIGGFIIKSKMSKKDRVIKPTARKARRPRRPDQKRRPQYKKERDRLI